MSRIQTAADEYVAAYEDYKQLVGRRRVMRTPEGQQADVERTPAAAQRLQAALKGLLNTED